MTEGNKSLFVEPTSTLDETIANLLPKAFGLWKPLLNDVRYRFFKDCRELFQQGLKFRACKLFAHSAQPCCRHDVFTCDAIDAPGPSKGHAHLPVKFGIYRCAGNIIERRYLLG